MPLAYALARVDFPGKRWVESLVDVPILVPQSVAGVALIVLLGPGSVLGERAGKPLACPFRDRCSASSSRRCSWPRLFS